MIKKRKECDLCGKEITLQNFSKHRGSQSCLNPYSPIPQILNSDMTCLYCENKFENNLKSINKENILEIMI